MRYERVADKIVIEQSRKGAIILVALFLVIIVGWQWVVFGMPKNLQELRSLDKGFVGQTGINPIFFISFHHLKTPTQTVSIAYNKRCVGYFK